MANKTKDSALIIMRIMISGKRLNYSTGQTINPAHWDYKKGLAKSIRGRIDYISLNDHLLNLSGFVQSVFINKDHVTAESLKKELDFETGRTNRPSESNENLLGFFSKFVAEQKVKINSKEDAWKKSFAVFNHLSQYEKDRKVELDFDSIDWNFRNDFEQWLYSYPRNHSQNTASKIFDIIKQVMREAFRRGIHQNITFQDRGFGIRRMKLRGKVRFDFKELDELLLFDFSNEERLEKVRDLFIIGCFTGLRFSDWHKVSRQNIKVIDGRERLEVITEKTSQPVIIPLLRPVKLILEKYSYNLPDISIQKFNDYIKEVIQIALPESDYMRTFSASGKTSDERSFKWEKVSSHAARRSFATNFYGIGISPMILMQITGHTTETQFRDYIDIGQEKLAKEFEKQMDIVLPGTLKKQLLPEQEEE